MPSALIAGLFVALLAVCRLWLAARSEVADLRTQVAYLKRRLNRTGR